MSKKPTAFSFSDRWAKTQAVTTATIEVYGETLTIPTAVPAAVLLALPDIQSLQVAMSEAAAQNDGQAIADAMRTMLTQITRLLGIVVGTERVQRWLDQGATIEQLTDLLVYIARGCDVSEDDASPLPAPAVGA